MCDQFLSTEANKRGGRAITKPEKLVTYLFNATKKEPRKDDKLSSLRGS